MDLIPRGFYDDFFFFFMMDRPSRKHELGLKCDVYEKDNLMILFSNPQDIVRMTDNGIKFQSINIGGMHYSHGKKQLLPNLSVDKNDVDSFLKLIDCGIELETRALPQDDRYNACCSVQWEYYS